MESSFKVASIFTDNMVLQRDSEINVWGEACTGSTITVEIGDVKVSSVVSFGKWQVKLPKISTSENLIMKIYNGENVIVFNNILMGDVYLAGGQSNMEFVLRDSASAKKEIPLADFPYIRYYNVPKIEFEDEANIDNQPVSKWQIISPQTAGDLSGVAYYFAKGLYKELNVPIGIINCNWGGTLASCWMDKSYIEEDDELRVFQDEFKEGISKNTDEELDVQNNEYWAKVNEWVKNCEEYKKLKPGATQEEIDKSIGPYPWPPPLTKKSFLRPSGLYYTMFRKVNPYSLKGFIYYQGESDAVKANLYKKAMTKLIENWRKDFENEKLPFLFVQLPFFQDANSEEDYSWAYLREAQLEVMESNLKVYMTTITDCGEKTNIHPLNKKTVGERLSLLALSKVYDKPIEAFGPLFKSMEIKDNKIILHFDHIGSGLICKGEYLKGFVICDEERKFKEAKAEIKGSTVEVSAKGIYKPLAVRFGWANYTETNLYNKEGIPASPFRTDK